MKKIKKLLTIGLAGLITFGMFTGCDLIENSSNDSQSGSSSCEHTYEWVGSEGGHQKVYTCGCPYPDIVELHTDNNGDGKCDVCGWSMDGILPEIVPEASYFEVIDELQILDIQRIETVEYAGSVAPNIRKPIEYKTSMSATDIQTVYTWLKSLQGTLTKIADEEAQLEGAGTKIFTIYTSQNYYFTIRHVGRNYLNIEGGFYEQEGNIPEIVGETITYKFESYYDEAELYIDNEKVKDYTFNFDELVCIEKDFDTDGKPYKLVTSIGSLYLYDETHFIRNDIKYEIVGTVDFSQIFDDHPTNDSNDSNDIFYTASYPQDFEYNGRHYRLVQGVGLKTTVTQEELGELLGYIIREEDVSAFTQEYPNVNYVIYNGIYDYETKNRVAFYSVKAYPDLSFICMNQLGDYVLFQDVTDLLA